MRDREEGERWLRELGLIPPETPSSAPSVIAIASGKGGVGKSTVCVNLALALIKQGFRVGVLDADVYGPNVPLLLNMKRTKPGESWTLARDPSLGPLTIEPVEKYGLKVMSTGFLLSDDQVLSWDARLVEVLVEQMFRSVQWGRLDFLLVDLPPGTADILQSMVRRSPITAAVVVVTPSDMSHLDARRVIAMFRAARIPIIGGVENMRPTACETCGTPAAIEGRVVEERSIWSLDVGCLGGIPADGRLAEVPRAVGPIVVSEPDALPAKAFSDIARRIAAWMAERSAS